MTILLLGGLNPKNQLWLTQFEQALNHRPDKPEVLVHPYAFWQNDEALADEEHISREIEAIKRSYKNKSIDLVIGKSFGAYMALTTAQDLRPKHLFLLGLPVGALAESDIDVLQLLHQNTTPTLLLNNTDDPQLAPQSVDALTKIPSIHSLVLRRRANHTYDDFPLYVSLLALTDSMPSS